MTTEREALEAAIHKLDGHGSNALDVQIEVALFRPNSVYTACRSNTAGSKVIYTDQAGNEVTCRAEDWTKVDRRLSTLMAIKQTGANHAD